MADSTTTRELHDSFLRYCQQRRSAATVRQYTQRLKPFVALYGNRPFASLTRLEIQDYLATVDRWPDGRPKAPDTCRANAVALEQIQKFALDFEVIAKRVFQPLEKPAGRQREALPTPEQVQAVLDRSSPAFRLIYRALRQSGARPNELARATFEHWDQDGGLIVLAEHKTARKTGQARKIAVGERLREILLESTAGRDAGPLFLTPRGQAWTTSTLSRAYARARDAAGLPRDLVLYLARHEHATQLCDKLGLEHAAAALGHASLTTTRRYTRTKSAKLRANQDVFDPGTVPPATSSDSPVSP